MTKKNKILLLLSFLIFILLLITVVINKTVFLDKIIYESIKSIQNPFLNKIFIGITKLGNAIPVTLICIIYVLLNREEGKYVIACVITSMLLNLLLKNIVSRTRPDAIWLIKESGFSFPSGHAMASMALYGMLFYFISLKKFNYKKLVLGLMISLIILIGISRIYVGVHFPSDILAGFSLSFCVVLIYIYLYQKEVEYVS